MAYITNADVIKRIGGTVKAAQYTTESGAAPDTALIDELIEGVEGQINSALRKRTAATITAADYPATVDLLREIAAAMVIFKIALRRPNMPEDWKTANAEAVKWLSDLSEGKVDLPEETLSNPRTGYDSYRDSAGPEAMI